MSQWQIRFQPSGRGKAQCESNPEFPNGRVIDTTQGRPGCTVDLSAHYPAPECGALIAHCTYCHLTLGATVAGRPDDPIKLKIACVHKVGSN